MSRMNNHTNHASSLHIPESRVIIAVMGATGSGKSTFINLSSGSGLQVGPGLQSCTASVQSGWPFMLDGFSIQLIDTPGFDDTSKSDTDILKLIASYLSASYEIGLKLSGIVYMHRISDNRMGGISRRNFKIFRELCGNSTLKNVVIVTNMWSKVSQEEGEARETELISQDLFFKPVLDKGAQIVRHHNTVQSAHDILRRLVRNCPIALRIQKELVDEKKDISETAAGGALSRELVEQAQRHHAELQEIRKEMEEAIKNKDQETREELETVSQKLREDMGKALRDSQSLAAEYREEKARLERQMRDAEQARFEAQKAAEDYQRRMEENVNASAEQREEMRRRMEELARRAEEWKCVIQ